MSIESLYQKGNDEYRTPAWIRVGLFSKWFDPCPLRGETETTYQDGLRSDWFANRIFINPPYSKPAPWVERAIKECRENHKVIALLLKHDSSTGWWAKLHEASAYFLPIMGRLHFNNLKGAAPFPSVIALLVPDTFSE